METFKQFRQNTIPNYLIMCTFQVPLEAAINDCERDYEWHDVRFLKTLIKLDFLVGMHTLLVLIDFCPV